MGFGRLLKRGRKYGAEVHWTSQRSSEIPKTAITQTAVKVIGRPDEVTDQKRMAQYARTSADNLLSLKPLEYYINDGAGEGRFLALKYKTIK